MQPIIFDFNGTMFLDTKENEMAWREEIKKICNKSVTDEEFKNFLHGSLNEVIVRHYAGNDLPEDKVNEYAKDKELIYQKLCLIRPEGIALTPGLSKVLDILKAHNTPINIASSAMPMNMDFYFAHMDLNRWFDRQKVVCNDGTLPGKPDPAFYLEAAKRINVRPEDCMVIEDAISGIKSAHAAGMKNIIAIASTNPPEYFAKIPEVNAVIQDFFEFEKFLKF